MRYALFCRVPGTSLIAIALLCAAVVASAQARSCPVVADRAVTPAEQAYRDADFAGAESLYSQALAQHSQDADLSEALVRTLLREGKLDAASTQATSAVAVNPHSAPALTAEAEVFLRQGQPWLAMQSLNAATSADPCFARAHLVRARALRIDSMYASERAEIQRAYDIDPKDADILAAWASIVNPAHEIESVQQSLATMKDIDPEVRKRAEANAHAMMPLLSENSLTCKVLPTIASATLPLLPSMPDPRHIDGYKLQVQFPQTEAKLLVDSAGSGLYISRSLAEANGLKHDPDAPEGTVHLDKFRVGPMEFADCTVGVTDIPFAGKGDGSMGTDLFAPYLITLDFRLAKMMLEPLPPAAGIVPGDRSASPLLADFVPVYHRRHYLLIPIEFTNKSRKLFILATGMRFSAMSSDAAHSVSKMTMNFTNSEQTTTGAKAQFFRDTFDLQLASLPVVHQSHILEFDPAVADHNAGFKISGMLGLDVIGSMTVHLDYRDGLVKFDTIQKEIPSLLKAKGSNPAPPVEAVDCLHYADNDIPITSTVEATIGSTIDSAHLKPGKEIWVKAAYGWLQPDCRMERGSILYGRVMAASSSKDATTSELSLIFDHADCVGHTKQPISLQLIGLVGIPDAGAPMASALPSEVAGGGRSMDDIVTATNGRSDNLNPSGRPNTVRPGVVIRMPKVKLEPAAGPTCSDRITSTNHSVQLGPGSELILLINAPLKNQIP